jgi:hypothetical protein
MSMQHVFSCFMHERQFMSVYGRIGVVQHPLKQGLKLTGNPGKTWKPHCRRPTWVKMYKQGEYAIINRKTKRCDCISPSKIIGLKVG